MNRNTNRKKTGLSGENITRKEAIKKAGITALTATTMLFLSTQKASASSTQATRPGR
ncbi:MAG: hypothetical protein HN778_06020 [Prolixibacteraceae bacterium]|jgi:hypothetical protein|nr:hypothetical protein [Prolixibacteraceae bacterium]MBT6007374.1 hypothetical protein [Prolixibacteraceae bacterium]MBT6767227.1 hypothetical protein [Prolixibacteraceae bacterium]MBT6999147.1 hypothetical protein [Prolixibacteraceae bacterium]MBT7394371.1 hypothetical protein [Prolixibacteraceae bacterium]